MSTTQTVVPAPLVKDSARGRAKPLALLIDATPILITGCPRSGTTWVGSMLAYSPPLAYIHEPFNPGLGHRFTRARFPRQFELVTSETAPLYGPALQDTLNFYYDLGAALQRCGRPKFSRYYWRQVMESMLTGLRFAVHRRVPLWRPLVKDPIALVSAEWLSQSFKMKVVVMVRSPLGVVSSLLRFPGMITPPSAYLDQPSLLKLLPPSYTEELHRAQDKIDQAIVQWRVLNQLAALYRSRNPDWIFVHYEEVADRPEDSFRHLCNRLNLPFTARMLNVIANHSHPKHATEPAKPWVLKRNSRLSKDQWKMRLTPEQVDYISQRCQDVWAHFFPNPASS